MWSLYFRRFDDELIARLWEAGTVGILEAADGLRAYFGSEVQPQELAELGGEWQPIAEPQCNRLQDEWEPIAVGERFLIAPASFRESVPESRLLLRLQSGAAFGTGRHETTQLCLEAMESYLRPGDTVLDVGCGSGILSAAAHLLGAARVFSCDIDEQAIAMTRRHASTPVFRGSADAIATGALDVVVANLTTAILDRLAWDLRRIMKPDGLLLLTGFLRRGAPESFLLEREFEREDWLCWVCRPQGIRAKQPPSEGLSHAAEWWL